jgi:hypothetical protein
VPRCHTVFTGEPSRVYRRNEFAGPVSLTALAGRLPSVFRRLEDTGELPIRGWLLESSGWFGPSLQVVYCPPEVLLIFRSAA